MLYLIEYQNQEKLLFLLKYEFDTNIAPFYDFQDQKWGPFSGEIIDDIIGLNKIGLVEISEIIHEPYSENSDIVTESIFELTETGIKFSKQLFKKLSRKTKISIENLDKYNKMKLKKLLNYVHKNYPPESYLKK